LLFATDWPVSPLFVFFLFALLAATLRWHWQAVVATTLIFALAPLAAKIINVAPLQADNDFHTVIIRSAYLIVVGAMVAYVSSFRMRTRDRLARLAHWPARKSGEENNLSLPQILAHSASVLEASKVVVVWEEAEEPYIFVSSWYGGSYHEKRERAGTFGSLVAPALSNAAFFTGDVSSSEVAMLSNGTVRVTAPVIDRDLIKEFSIQSASTAPFMGIGCSGRIFICDCDCWSDDHLMLSKIVAFRTGTALDRRAYQHRNEEAIASRERARLTRDLHDGILQTLTAASLQLSLADSLTDQGRTSRLELVKKLLAKEQRRIREFVEQTRSKAAFAGQTTLRSDLEQLLDESAAQWNCKTSLSVEPPDVKVAKPLFGQLSFMFAEAVANAVRHGGASIIDVVMEKTDGDFLINIRDNGKGFHSRAAACEHDGPTVLDRAPISLRERVSALGGSVRVISSSKGAQLAIRVPVQ
jgi:signal transduction histidine kinase